jgi:Zn-dependent protease with chaperone function
MDEVACDFAPCAYCTHPGAAPRSLALSGYEAMLQQTAARQISITGFLYSTLYSTTRPVILRPLITLPSPSNQDGYSPGRLVAEDLQGITNNFQRLARFLDRPLFPWKKLIVGFSIAQYLFEGFLSLRQYQVLKQTSPPKVLKNEVSQDVFDKSQVCRFFPRRVA